MSEYRLPPTDLCDQACLLRALRSPARRRRRFAYDGRPGSRGLAAEWPPVCSLLGLGWLVTASAGTRRARRLTGDRVSRRRQREPATAERCKALAVGVAGLLVALVEVVRVAVVGDLRLPVGALGRFDHPGICPLPTVGLPFARSGGQALAHAP